LVSLNPFNTHHSTLVSTSCHSSRSPLTNTSLQVNKQAMLREKPMEIPEILAQVASYLGRHDLTKCVRVSKGWRDILLPQIWREITVYDSGRRCPCPDDLYPRRHMVHSLSLHYGEMLGLGTVIYPNLRSLGIFDFYEYKNPTMMLSVDFAKACPSLVYLELVRSRVASTTWMALSAHPHIRRLKLARVNIEAIDAPWFWKVCEKLEDLRIFEVSIQGPIPKDLALNRLRKLYMSCNKWMDEEAQMDLAYRSTMLESLDWDLSDHDKPKTRWLIRHPIQNNHWPNLHRLQINVNTQDAVLASFIRGAGNGQGSITVFEPRRCELGVQASRNLSLHFNTLVWVDVSRCNTSIRSTVPDILCSCPNLRNLSVGNVFAKDIAARGPWVCRQLRSLMVCFRVGDSEQCLQLHQLIFERLSTLIQLKKLRMCAPSFGDVVENVLEFRLEYGLGQLASLQELSTVIFTGSINSRNYEPQLGIEEVVWMAGNWKKLRKIGGCLNTDGQMESQLAAGIKSLGIRYHLGSHF
ncbi:MAG: hypothetical protein J3Q66DRAFT_159967, partial [Benniella sp.]